MNYQEFLTNIKTQLSLRIDTSLTLDIQTFPKNNGTQYDGLVILHPDLNISPTIYLLPYYHSYLEGVCLEDIYEDILSTYRSHLPKEDFDTSIFTDYKKAHSRIVMRLVSYKRNEELLKSIPHFRYQDLAIVFYCMLHADEHNQANILIHNEHLPLWNITKDSLYHAAVANTPKLLPYELIPMSSLLGEPGADDDLPLYILTNKYRTNGATVILYDGLLNQISGHFQKDLIILPSSIHEVLLIPVDSADEEDLSHYTEMVQNVNDTELADDEILSGHSYYFSRTTGLLSCHPESVSVK